MRISKKYPKGTSIKSKNNDLKIKFLYEIVVLRHPQTKNHFIEVSPNQIKKLRVWELSNIGLVFLF
ncbi:hypothetical protein [Leptospira santarosai]|uniref:hypothetical protein n=1 Tax=Leptospira santarosai TaxID=28183 RepID=UPI000248A524|nr:hypothetical protein [Leptospira santarosai]EMM76157.1 hypothetical protein LEP1GSC040_3542 [Leptospira santarosai str. 2000030832]